MRKYKGKRDCTIIEASKVWGLVGLVWLDKTLPPSFLPSFTPLLSSTYHFEIFIDDEKIFHVVSKNDSLGQ